MAIYILAILASTFFAYVYEKHSSSTKYTLLAIEPRDIYLFISFMILFLLSGFRKNVGADYLNYRQWFMDIAGGAESYFESGFTQIIRIISHYTLNPDWLFIVSAFISLSAIYLTIRKYSKSITLSVFLFCSMSFLFYSFNATRQFIAIALVFSAWGFMINRKFLKYAITILVASLFHKSALIMLPAYFILNIRYKLYQYIAMAVLSVISFFYRDELLTKFLSLFPKFNDTYSKYINGITISEIFMGTSILMIFIVIYLIKLGYISRDNTSSRIGINVIFFSTIINTWLSWIPLIYRFGFLY